MLLYPTDWRKILGVVGPWNCSGPTTEAGSGNVESVAAWGPIAAPNFASPVPRSRLDLSASEQSGRKRRDLQLHYVSCRIKLSGLCGGLMGAIARSEFGVGVCKPVPDHPGPNLTRQGSVSAH